MFLFPTAASPHATHQVQHLFMEYMRIRMAQSPLPSWLLCYETTWEIGQAQQVSQHVQEMAWKLKWKFNTDHHVHYRKFDLILLPLNVPFLIKIPVTRERYISVENETCHLWQLIGNSDWKVQGILLVFFEKRIKRREAISTNAWHSNYTHSGERTHQKVLVIRIIMRA